VVLSNLRGDALTPSALLGGGRHLSSKPKNVPTMDCREVRLNGRHCDRHAVHVDLDDQSGPRASVGGDGGAISGVRSDAEPS